MEQRNWAVYRDCFGSFVAFPDLGPLADINGRVLSQRVSNVVTRGEAENLSKEWNLENQKELEAIFGTAINTSAQILV